MYKRYEIILLSKHIRKRVETIPRHLRNAHSVGREAFAQQALLLGVEVYQVVGAVGVGGDEEHVGVDFQDVC